MKKSIPEKDMNQLERTKKGYDEYGAVKRIYEEYKIIRRQLGKAPSQIINISEMEENLKALGGVKVFPLRQRERPLRCNDQGECGVA